MIDANEESEIFESMGRAARTAAAGGTQAAETASRRAQMSQSAKEREGQDQQRHADTMQRLKDRDHKEEATLAQVIRQDAYQRHFWRQAGSEQIADYLTASAHLAPRHAEARSASMHIADVLRNDYGINIEQMNRDHPTSLMNRHHALRDALDDYFHRHHMGAEADQARGQQQSPTIDSEVDRTSGGQDEAADQVSDADELQARTTAAQAGRDKTASLGDAQQHKGEARRDAVNARTEGATGGRGPRLYQRSTDADLETVRGTSAQAAAVRSRTRQNFPQPSTQRVFSMDGPAARRGAADRPAPARDLEAGR